MSKMMRRTCALAKPMRGASHPPGHSHPIPETQFAASRITNLGSHVPHLATQPHLPRNCGFRSTTLRVDRLVEILDCGLPVIGFHFNFSHPISHVRHSSPPPSSISPD